MLATSLTMKPMTKFVEGTRLCSNQRQEYEVDSKSGVCRALSQRIYALKFWLNVKAGQTEGREQS